MSLPRSELLDATLDLAVAAAAVANHCDHAEHNESAPVEDVRSAALVFRKTGVRLSQAADQDPLDLYAARLRAIEERNVHYSVDSYDGAEAARAVTDWRALQLVQDVHDKAYHYDVVGLKKSDQLRHYALHLSKLVGACAGALREEVAEEDLVARRVPDMLLFGLKLSTVTAEKLPHESIVPSGTAVDLRAVA
ncbi:MAG TPA: hypothetical protein VMF55_03120 [Solirubrobacterales bacterium]|nr:hypothetical protein [Solirubrobacterales bacterium]